MKEYLRDALSEGYTIVDLGPEEYDETDDYPVTLEPLLEKVAKDDTAFGIVIGGSGQGEAMTANRFKGIRAAVYYGEPVDILTLSREHNDANVLSLGARFVELDEALGAVKLWLATPFSGDNRHVRRIHELDTL